MNEDSYKYYKSSLQTGSICFPPNSVIFNRKLRAASKLMQCKINVNFIENNALQN